MELNTRELADVKSQLEELTEKAAETDVRIETVKREAAQVKKKATRAQRRLKSIT